MEGEEEKSEDEKKREERKRKESESRETRTWRSNRLKMIGCGEEERRAKKSDGTGTKGRGRKGRGGEGMGRSDRSVEWTAVVS